MSKQEPSKEIQKWADDFMFKAEEIDVDKGIEVWLIDCNNDPLGSIASAAKAYKGEFVTGLHEITDAEREYYLGEVQKSALAMPLESVRFHFRLKGVTRGFTHQMVRQRTAAYSQESTRFAVKERVPVGLPPSLAGTTRELQKLKDEIGQRYPAWREHSGWYQADAAGRGDEWLAGSNEWNSRSGHVSKEEYWRGVWDKTVEHIERAYNELVNQGMPAEDARGLLPTNLLTQLNYFTNLRNYKDEAGKRLCTQAQFEWRIAFSKMMEAIREYGKTQTYQVHYNDVKPGVVYKTPYRPNNPQGPVTPDWNPIVEADSDWQFNALADLFRPICYYKGSCQFLADFDRKCSIRDRVQANAAVNRPSSEWNLPLIEVNNGPGEEDRITAGSIRPSEWLLDPTAAR